MSIRKFTEEQIKELLQNPNVAKCSGKSILYHKDFKISAVKKYLDGMPPSWIFKEAGFSLAVVGHGTPKWCISRWMETFRNKGEAGLKEDGRKNSNPWGRPKGIKHLSDKEKLKYLETQVAYLKAENSFLAKLRKKS